VLLLDFQSRLPEPMCQRVLIYLLQVPMAMVGMDVIGGLSYEVTMKLHLLVIGSHNAVHNLAATNAMTFLFY
jgi:hypothetical protein